MHPLSRPLTAAQTEKTAAQTEKTAARIGKTGKIMEARIALLAGATGKVGGHCLRLLLESPRYKQVLAPARRAATAQHPKLRWLQTDFDALETIALPAVDDAFCALGVRWGSLLNRRELELAEYAYPLAFAKLARARGARRFFIVTSVAANADSPLSYLRLKGRLEEDLKKLEFPRLDVFRPSFLLPACGVRNAANALLRGRLRQYRAVSPLEVAAAMAAGAAAAGDRRPHPSFRFPRPCVISWIFRMVKTEREYARDIVEVGKLVFQKGWVAANDGNISIRLDDERIMCTPTGVSKGMMSVDDIIVVDTDGNKISGRLERTSEIMMHLTIYKIRPDVDSVVHAHPPAATGFAAAGRALDTALLPEVIIGLGCVPLAGYGLPGTDALTEPMLPLIPKYDALLLGNHGAVSYGKDVMQAYFRMETVEHFARINFVAEMLGGAKALPRLEVDKLFESRGRYGVSSNATAAPGCPVTAEDARPATAGGNGRDGFFVTREELIRLVEEAIRARGV